MKVLLIDDDATYRRLLRQHLVTAFEAPVIAEHVPAVEGRLPAEFSAAGFDAVLLDHAPAGGSGLEWLADGRARPLFPPVIYLIERPDETAAAAAVEQGALGVIAKSRIDHRELVQLLRSAENLQRRALGAFRASPAAEKAYKFGHTVIKGVRCIRAIASSAISTVYLAESEREAKLVVLKLLRQVPDSQDRGSTFDRFLQEYEIIRQIHHPNVVSIYELGVADDHAFILMEYFPSGDLRARMRRGIVPLAAVGILRQMAAALAAIHAAGVLHRDLKPGNVMMRADGTIALIDFGLAKQLSLEAEITATGEIFGTPYYMSPEQGHGRDVDARSDIYSLGVIFYEMLTGKKPFLAPTPMAVIYKHSHAPIPRLPEDIAEWQPLLERLLGKEPAERFQTGLEICAAIDAQLDARPAAGAAPAP
ncbi:MAG TPA: protein kinase [Steroidobacteraceae bacterium]|nr:protein kinase [Steroidobacteraceae bacterium]